MKKSYIRRSTKRRSKRRTYGRTKSFSSSPAYKQLAVMLNPFSSATDVPKIPDGSYTESFGERLNHISTIAHDAATTKVTNFDFIKGVQIIFRPNFDFPYIAIDGTGALKFPTNGTNHVAGDADPTTYEIYTKDLVDKSSIKSIRIVSVGYRIQLMNNADDNEGYFSVGRRNPTSGIPAWEKPEKLNGFVCGKLRDIHKYQFNLHPTGRSFENLTLESPFHDENTNSVNLVSGTNGFDEICLLLSGGVNTKVMIFTSINFEFCLNPTEGMHRFQTVCYAYPNLVDSYLPKIKRDVRAALPLTGSFPLA